LEGPRRDEELVKVVATGLCHTDMVARDKGYPVPHPIVLGHEGAGIVRDWCNGAAGILAGPLIVNILLFHVLMDPAGIAPGLVVTTLWFVIYWQFRAAFYGVFFTESRSDRAR
jgi:hypothetical protein